MAENNVNETQTPRWEERPGKPPDIDIDYWTLLSEARILAPQPFMLSTNPCFSVNREQQRKIQ